MIVAADNILALADLFTVSAEQMAAVVELRSLRKYFLQNFVRRGPWVGGYASAPSISAYIAAPH